MVLCPLCNASTSVPLIKIKNLKYLFCKDCGMVYDKDKSLLPNRIINDNYSLEDYILRVKQKHKMHEIRKRFLEERIRTDGLSLLDIGTSDGSFLSILDNMRVFGVEPEQRFIRFCKEYFGITLINGYFEDIEFDQTFNIVTAFDVLEHIYEPHKFLSKIYDILKPDGLIYLSLPPVKCHAISIAKGHVCLYSVSTITQVLEANGFKIVCLEEDRIGDNYPDHIDVIARKFKKAKYLFRCKDNMYKTRLIMRYSILRGYMENFIPGASCFLKAHLKPLYIILRFFYRKINHKT